MKKYRLSGYGTMVAVGTAQHLVRRKATLENYKGYYRYAAAAAIWAGTHGGSFTKAQAVHAITESGADLGKATPASMVGVMIDSIGYIHEVQV